MVTTTLALEILPITTNRKTRNTIIDAAISEIQESGISYEVGPMETTIEGNVDEVLTLAAHVLKKSTQHGQVFIAMKLLHNPKGIMTIQEKVDQFREKLY